MNRFQQPITHNITNGRARMRLSNFLYVLANITKMVREQKIPISVVDDTSKNSY